MMTLLIGLGVKAAALNRSFASDTESNPAEIFLVLGGSIKREIHAAALANQYPQARFLIAHGSKDPCIVLIFQRTHAPLANTWHETCSNSTFENYLMSLKMLKQWQARNIRLVTSPTHLPRSLWLGQILLGAHGIRVTPEIIEEQGIPGNRESWVKTLLDIMRGFVWGVASQVYVPTCSNMSLLSEVDLELWQEKSFRCEHQGGIQQDKK